MTPLVLWELKKGFLFTASTLLAFEASFYLLFKIYSVGILKNGVFRYVDTSNATTHKLWRKTVQKTSHTDMNRLNTPFLSQGCFMIKQMLAGSLCYMKVITVCIFYIGIIGFVALIPVTYYNAIKCGYNKNFPNFSVVRQALFIYTNVFWMKFNHSLV